jgi:hypothetical protein
MTTAVGFDRIAEYQTKLKTFVDTLQALFPKGSEIHVEVGRKYDKVYVAASDRSVHPRSLYMVDRNGWNIYGVKSWAQVNERRWYGTLDTIDDWDWRLGTPKTGTPSEQAFKNREESIQQQYKPRGRPRKRVN